MRQSKTLLIVDDDADLREALAEQLTAEREFKVVEAADARSGMITAMGANPDLILLDVDLPDGNGRELCMALAEAGISAPVIMLTGADSETDTVAGLDAGAADYVTKPFRFSVLLARIRAQLRAREQADDIALRMGPLTFKPAAKLLFDEAGEKIRLTDKESAILKYLHRAGRAVPREELLADVWGYNAGVTTHTLETHVYRLRQKIDGIAPGKRILTTESGGYRINLTP